MRIKNWSKFQHFKDRRPPWVKLYRDLLDDMEWHELDSEAAKVLVMLWLIASEGDGVLPGTKELAFRLRTTEKSIKTVVSKLGHWLEHGDIRAISERYQDDPTETEGETDTEAEKRQKGPRFRARDFLLACNVSEQVADDWLLHRKAKNAAPTKTAIDGIEREAAKAGVSLQAALAICCQRGWVGFNAEWIEKHKGDSWLNDLIGDSNDAINAPARLVG